MLDKMGFKKEFVSLCRSALSESGVSDMAIEERKVNKAQRGKLNGILFMKEGVNCAPTYYIEDFYKEYRAGTSISELSHEVVNNAIISMNIVGGLANRAVEILTNTDYLGVRLINKARNKDYLKDVPFRDMGGELVLIMQVEYLDYLSVVTEELLKEYNLSETNLFSKALLNSMDKYPAMLHDLAESALSELEGCENYLEGPAGRAPAGAGPGFVLTNSRYFWGAGALFYPGVIDRIHELLDDDFYVLPSSVHELIILPVEDQDPKVLVDMIRSANRAVLEDDDILADDLYICKSGKLSRVSYGGVIPSPRSQIC